MKKTEEEGSCMEEAMSVFRNTRNESGYSPNQLFFLRNWRDHHLPDLRPEPTVEEMVKARDRVKGGCYKVKKDELSSAWPRLLPGDMVRGQHPRTKEWSLKGEVLEMVTGDRAVNVELDKGVTRLFARDAVRKDTTRAYQEQKRRSSGASWQARSGRTGRRRTWRSWRRAETREAREGSSTWRTWGREGASGWPRRM